SARCRLRCDPRQPGRAQHAGRDRSLPGDACCVDGWRPAAMSDGMIYLDYAASTPLAPEARAAMLEWLDDSEGFGNPSSDHGWGRRARAAVEAARAQVAGLIGAQAEEIIWTSGATEATNLAIKGALEFRGRQGAH